MSPEVVINHSEHGEHGEKLSACLFVAACQSGEREKSELSTGISPCSPWFK